MTTNWPAKRHGSLLLASQRTVVRVNADAQAVYRVSRMQNPDRLVLDFTNARIGSRKLTIPSELSPVLSVRLGQFKPEVARVVIDLDGAAPYSVDRDGRAVVVSFETPEAAHSESAAARPVARFTSVSKTGRPHNPRNHVTSAIPTPKIALPAELTQTSAYFARFAGRQQVQAPAQPVPAGASQQPAQQPATAPPVAAPQTPAPVGASGEKYSGTPLSVNLKAVDLVDFFRLITEVSGLNVVIDPAVKGSLSIVLNEVPWDQALDIVLQNNGLDKQLNGNVLRIATKETLKKEADMQADLIKSQSKAIELTTVTRVLSYAKAATMKDTLKKFLSDRGDMISDDRSNTLIIHDIPQVVPAIDNLIRQLDKKTQMVEIEARLVSATRSFAKPPGPRKSGDADKRSTAVGHQLGRAISNYCDQLLVHLPEPRLGLHHFHGRGQGCWQASFEAESQHAEQRKSHGQAGREDSRSDSDQQHDYRSVCGRRPEARSNAADYRRWHDLYGRPRRKHPDRQRYSARPGYPSVGHAIRRVESAGERWRNRGNRRCHRFKPADQHHRSADYRESPANWASVPPREYQQQLNGVVVLLDATNRSRLEHCFTLRVNGRRRKSPPFHFWCDTVLPWLASGD